MATPTGNAWNGWNVVRNVGNVGNAGNVGTGEINADALAARLGATPGADDWQFHIQRDDEAQLYLTGPRVESRRHVENERARVVLYNDHPSHAPAAEADAAAPARGITALSLLASDLADPAQLDAHLRDAITMAGLTDNPPYALPGPTAGGFPSVETSDPALTGDLDAALEQAHAQLEDAVARQPGIRLSSAELYATRTSDQFRNSRGIAGSYTGTTVALDLVLFAQHDGEEFETHAEPSRRRLQDLEIEKLVAAYATFARDAARAVLPGTHRGPVILSGEALPRLFSPLEMHSAAQAAFQQLSRLRPGELVTTGEPRGDRLTLISDATRPYGLKTTPYDDAGVPASRMVVVENGVLRGYWADARYAAYLGVPPTGDFANLTITPGSRSLADLRDASGGVVYEIVAFSFLMPNPVSGDFVAEIKLGYRHDAHGTMPIKGGSVAGNLFDALNEAYLSTETYSDGAYFGPAAIRFGELNIAGA